MTTWYKRTGITALLLVLTAGLAHADLSKLDPRARVALAGLTGGMDIRQMVDSRAAVSETGDLDVFIAGEVTRAELEAAGAIVRTELPGLFTAYVPVGAIDAVAAIAGVVRIQGAAPVYEENNLSVPSTQASAQRGAGPAFAGANGAGILVGTVDSGVDWGHEDFDDAGGNTRLINIWDQTDAIGPNPPGFAYGSHWTAADINANLPREVDTSTHGSHVLGTAAGDGSAVGGGGPPAHTWAGMAPMADLMCVKTNFQTTGVVDGISYIFGRATNLGKNSVVNISLGTQFGPHDGTSSFETALNALTGAGRVIVNSAGNDRANAMHAEVLAAGAGTNVTMTVANSATNRVFAIDGYYEASENMNVRIQTPNGTVIGPITLGNMNAAYPGQATANGNVYIENGVFLTTTGDKEVYIEVGIPLGTNANGTWTFTFIPVALGAANGEVDLWRFFQSTGLAANFAIGNDAGSEKISEPGNAANLITVAAWVSRQNWTDCGARSVTFTGTPAAGNLATYSSPGPTRDGRQKPDIAAPGVAIGSTRSDDNGAVACPGAVTTLLPGLRHYINSGTSMAAPHVTGAVALLMQKFGAVTPAMAKTHLTTVALLDGFTGAVWNNSWGNGKLRVDVTDPVATVTAPNGGEILYITTNTNLTWTANDPILFGPTVTIDILLSRTGSGGPYTALATGLPNTGSYNWNVTGPPTADAWVKVVAIDPVTNQGTDISDAQFTIANQPVPVELALFLAEPIETGIKVSWKFNEDVQFAQVAVERGDAGSGPFSRLESSIETDQDGNSVVVDNTAEYGHTYFYRLVATSRSGQTSTFGPMSAIAGKPYTRFDLAPVWPNPSTGLARIDFTVPQESRVKVLVFDIQGRQVATLADGSYSPGKYQVTWDGSSETGEKASSGMYFVHMVAPDGKEHVQRVALAR